MKSTRAHFRKSKEYKRMMKLQEEVELLRQEYARICQAMGDKKKELEELSGGILTKDFFKAH